jgi:hypothetical protein
MDEFWKIQLEGSNQFHPAVAAADRLAHCDDDAAYGGSNIDDEDRDSRANHEWVTDNAVERDQKPKIYSFPYLQDNVCGRERQQQQDGKNGNNNNNNKYETTVTLELCTLPRPTGAFGPLGGEPWYGSALLASMLLLLPPPPSPTTNDTSGTDDNRGDGGGPLQRIHGHLQDVSNHGGMRVLELGSGAVAIPAFAAVLAILRQRRCQRRQEVDPNGSHHETGTNEDSKRRNIVAMDHDDVDEVILTDHDPQVLRQLRRNVESASLKLAEVARQESLSAAPRMVIHHLDWAEKTHCFDLWNIDLVIGSELVYTPETATSCFVIVRELLRCNNRDVLIVLVQIADRSGWHDTFLPFLLESGGFDIECSNVPVEIHQHAAAYRHVERGGTLNVLQDYEVCLISNNNNNEGSAARRRS